MINFRDSEDQTPFALAILGVVLIIGSGLASLFVRPPQLNTIKRKHNIELAKLNQEQKTAEEIVAKSRIQVNQNLWMVKPDSVQPVALESITKFAQETKVNIISFRPQKLSESAALRQLPFTLTVDGSFLAVANMINKIESTNSKLAVNQIQFASKEGESDQVTASITVVAFLDQAPVEKGSSKKATGTPSTSQVPGKENASEANKPGSKSVTTSGNNG